MNETETDNKELETAATNLVHSIRTTLEKQELTSQEYQSRLWTILTDANIIEGNVHDYHNKNTVNSFAMELEARLGIKVRNGVNTDYHVIDSTPVSFESEHDTTGYINFFCRTNNLLRKRFPEPKTISWEQLETYIATSLDHNYPRLSGERKALLLELFTEDILRFQERSEEPLLIEKSRQVSLDLPPRYNPQEIKDAFENANITTKS